MKTPDITKAQYIAVVQPILACAVAFGAPINSIQQAAILGLSGSVSTALVIADAIIRNGRSKMAAAVESNKVILGGLGTE